MDVRRIIAAAAVAAVAACGIVPAFAAAPSPAPGEGSADAAAEPELRIEPATSPIRVDAVLDEPAWQDALTLELRYELLPGDSTPAPVRTELLLAYDDKRFYFAFRAFDPDPAAIRAHLTDRDKAQTDDYVGIVMDTFHDQRRAFEFEVNPLGVQNDYTRNEVTGSFAIEDPTWDAIWDSAGRITPEGYVVEAAVPWSSLRFPRQPGEQTWGITAYRAYPRNVLHVLSLVPTDRNDPCLLCQIGDFTGFAGITPGRNLEITPTVIGTRLDQRAELPDGPMDEGDVDTEAGLSVRWGITPNVNLNATVDPDFSHVEADVAQLDVNVRFALFYPEKRPFFLEGADYFTTPFNIVHSRSIRDPGWGLKLTGKEGKHAIGAYVLEDDVTNLIFPANQGSALASFDRSSKVGVVRYRRDLGKSSTLGVLVTGRDGRDYSNRVYGVDGLLSLTPSDSIEFQLLESRTSYPEQVAADYAQPTGTFDGTAIHFRYEHAAEHWNYWAGYDKLDPGFRADLGFMPRVDTEVMEVGGKRILQRPEGSWFTRLELGLTGSRTEFIGGELSDEALGLVAAWQGPRQSNASLRLAREQEYFAGATYEQDTQEIVFGIRPTGDFFFTLTGWFGDAIDYENARAADRVRLGPGVNYRFGRHLDMSLDHLLERLDAAGGRLYDAELSQARVTYQFNVRTFLRAIVQHYKIDRNVELYLASVEEVERTLFTQLLFSYKLNPQTVLFLGYSDNHLGETGIDLTRTDRTLFVKLGYAWSL